MNQLHAFEAYQCLVDFDNFLGEIADHLSFISVLIRISSAMETVPAQGLVNRYLDSEIQTSAKLLPIARHAADLSAGYCVSSAIVAARAQRALLLLDEAARVLHWLGEHI